MGRYHSDGPLSTRGTASRRLTTDGPELAGFPEPQALRLLDQLRARIRRLGMARRTEEAYVGWVRRFILVNGKRHPDVLGEQEVERFLTALAIRDRVAPCTQNQALEALLFLYREVLGRELPWMERIQRTKRTQRLPTC